VSLRASKVAVTCHCNSNKVQINPAAAVVRPVTTDQPIPTAAWLCPECGCPGGTREVAMVTLLQMAGARAVDYIGAVMRHACPTCETASLVHLSSVVLFLANYQGGSSMRRVDCPVCGHVAINEVEVMQGVGLALIGVRVVADVLDLVPEEADALSDSSVDLHELLTVALAADAPIGD
jgi:hypothetical protein